MQAAKTQVAINKGVSPRRKNKRPVFSRLILKTPYCDVFICNCTGWDKNWIDFKGKGTR